ncbi:MAG: squalene synthase HpnC [Bryobacteraceae bacterium]|nr:squalene synthase HpnC [Bryobacteraceae bacterium]
MWTTTQAEAYTRWLATHHYENFQVVSFLLPKNLHQDFYNVYAFCRWADDLADEIPDKAEALRLLDWWRGLLHSMFAGDAWHPVFLALRSTVRKHEIPEQPFADLITAFVHDQTVSRYPAWQDVFDYCRFSANPVGHLVLYLCGYRDPERQRLSDSTCTALQLANFWQDVSIDLLKDRVYIPLEVMDRHAYGVTDLFAGLENDAFRAVMKDIVDRTRELFHAGLPLVSMVDRRLSIDLDLFSRGGMRVLAKIEAQRYNVLRCRPKIGKLERVGILLQSLVRQGFRPAA